MDPRETVIFAAADLHGALPVIEPCDVLVLAGDLAPYAIERDPTAMHGWLTGPFAHWLDAAPAAEVIAIAGNHDFWAAEIPSGVHRELFGARWTYLRDAEVTTASGLRVYGSPWTPDVYDSAFEAPRAELARIWEAIPTGLDVLVVHCPPLGHGDQLDEGEGPPTRMGSAGLVTAITRTRPRLVVFGHAHQGYGYRAEEPAGTRLANVTVRTDYSGGMHTASRLALP